ncbi:rab effector MyRIP [Bombina bombina]|uniref:rab effector MyRIP n=1 Tax=Bombina bombina TaxID=8345 RepID=UPI00235AAE9B|nr:rab effector MyRIP [Bombina bombina]
MDTAPKHLISIMYRSLVLRGSEALPTYTKQWIAELGLDFDSDPRLRAFRLIKKSSVSSTIQELHIKYLSRCELKQKLDDEVNKCSILSKQQKFNEHCCIRCCSPFTFLINSKRQCLDCKFNICKNCSSYQKKEKAWICNVCQQTRLLRTQSLEWYYNNVKSRFKRFGSAKVLKNLYRKHRLESGACADIVEGSFIDETFENEGSICGSDSTFYRQTQGHSMMDTLSVALRVAEEAVEEAIAKADSYRDSLDKQNEACYLREHKEELIEELATTIVQKIIKRKKSKGEQAEALYECQRSRASVLTSPVMSDRSMLALPESNRGSAALWRSHSAFSLSEDAPSSNTAEVKSTVPETLHRQHKTQSRRLKEHQRPSMLPSWKSVDSLYDSSPSPVLQSSDGNWVALQSITLPPPRLLAKPKSQMFTALESESSIVSAYDEMGSDTDEEVDWSLALNAYRRRARQMSDDSYYTDSQYNTEWACGNDYYQPVTSPSSGLYTNTETVYSDSETSSVNSLKESRGTAKSLWPNRKSPADQLQKENLYGKMDINFNPQSISMEYSDSSEAEKSHPDIEKRSRRWRKSKNTSEELGEGSNFLKVQKRTLNKNKGFRDLSETDMSSGDQHHELMSDSIEQKLKTRLCELSAKMSDKETSSGEEQDIEPRMETMNQEVLSSEENGKCMQEELKKKYSAVSLCNISTEVLKVINATEELIAGSTIPWDSPTNSCDRGAFPLSADPVRLDEQLIKLEENVYLAAGTVYGLEGQLNDIEDSARKINSVTTELELADLEDQVATAAAQVHHAERQISDIESRISALTVAGLNVSPCVRLTRRREQKNTNQVQTIDTSRQQRRKLPATPLQDEVPETPTVTTMRTFNRNFVLQGSLTQRSKERKSTAKGAMEPTKESTLMY